jgi:outer membrane murein-binding lipoprotein Lpp
MGFDNRMVDGLSYQKSLQIKSLSYLGAQSMTAAPAIRAMAVVLGLTLVSGPIHAAMYKWKDANGQVHYTQSPPPEGVTGEAVKPPPKVDTESAVEELKSKQEGFDKRLEEKAKADSEASQAAEKAAEKAKYCEDLRNNLAGLQSAQRIFTGEGEERRRMDEDERQARIKEINDKLAKDCQ